MAITTNNLISRQTVGSAGAASITFSNIPATFTDLRLVWSGRTDYAGVTNTMNILLNSASTTFTLKTVFGDGTTADTQSSSTNQYVGWIPGSTATASTFGNTELYIPNYTSSNQKSFSVDTVTENNATAVYNGLIAGLWSGTSAINSITLNPRDGNWVQYSTFSLYGISSNTSTQNTSVPSATGGDVITTDGTYWYHAFKASGTFTPLRALTADCLTIAGGGGGGSQYGGGGGAGGLSYSASNSLTATNYTVTIGAGGLGVIPTTGGGSDGDGKGTNGSNSQFGSLTAATGGGGGGRYRDSNANNVIRNGADGGSGGGGGAGTNASYVGSGGTGSQGNNGGSGGAYGSPINSYRGGGGGGVSVVGGNANSSGGGTGGNGSSTYSSWGSATSTGQNVSGTYYFAGGGGGGNGGDSYPSGGAGGYGGGGAGGNNASGTAGTANTGGGGGGQGAGGVGAGYQGANAGSGIVIVRYAV